MMLRAGIAKAAASGAFSPADLSPFAWYDISDTSTLWQDTAATTAATAHGDPVARVNDKSGNGYNLLQSTSTKRPLLQISGGLYYLLFDGSDDFLACAFTAPSALHKCVGIRLPSSSAADRYPMDSDTSLGDALYKNATGGLFRIRRTTFSADFMLTEDTPIVFTEYSIGGNANSTVQQNKGAVLTRNGGNPTLDGFQFGSRGNDSGFVAIRFYGAVAKSSEITGSDLTNLQDWMGDKMGIDPDATNAGSRTFTASGTFVVPDYTSLTVKVWGAGGGGGGSFANGNGSAGGQSKFDTSGPTANGGGGGTQGDSTGAGGAGGTASGGDTNTTGNSGSGGNIGGTGVGGTGGTANGSPPGSTGLGGNGADGGFEGNGGGGGGGGGYSTKTYSAGGLTVGASITVTVGTGGSAAPSAQAGQAGRVEITWS